MIEALRLVNVRNYIDREFAFHQVTVIVGHNGQGKTNIIEALFFLSTGRSFRTSRDNEIIRHEQPFSRLVSGRIDITITGGERTRKQVRIDSKPMRLIDILGIQPSILFTPMSIDLVDGSPASRRQFIDILLSQTDSHYVHQLLDYQRILKQRNRLLHQIANGQENDQSLYLWDDLLVQSSIPVMIRRKEMAELMHAQIDHWYHQISPHKRDLLTVEYAPSVEKRQTVTADQLEKLFHDRLRERRIAELRAGRTLVGPHRDDFIINLNHRPVADFGSRGEMRSVVVALKLFEYHYISEQSGKTPTMLFDDVFSEFDAHRRATLFHLVPNAQMIFTATDLEHIGALPKQASIIDLMKK